MTVGELKEKLSVYRDSMEIVSHASDCGGYDSILSTDIVVSPFEYKFDARSFPEYIGKLYVGGKDEN